MASAEPLATDSRRPAAPPRPPLVDCAAGAAAISVIFVARLGSPAIGLCLIAAAIVVFLAVKGLRYLDPNLLVHEPERVRRPVRIRRVPRPDRSAR